MTILPCWHRKSGGSSVYDNGVKMVYNSKLHSHLCTWRSQKVSAVKGLSIKCTNKCPLNFDNHCASSIQWRPMEGFFRRSQAQFQSDQCHTWNSHGLASFQYGTEITDVWNYLNKKIKSVENKRFISRVYTLTGVRYILLASHDL